MILGTYAMLSILLLIYLVVIDADLTKWENPVLRRAAIIAVFPGMLLFMLTTWLIGGVHTIIEGYDRDIFYTPADFVDDLLDSWDGPSNA